VGAGAALHDLGIGLDETKFERGENNNSDSGFQHVVKTGNSDSQTADDSQKRDSQNGDSQKRDSQNGDSQKRDSQNGDSQKGDSQNGDAHSRRFNSNTSLAAKGELNGMRVSIFGSATKTTSGEVFGGATITTITTDSGEDGRVHEPSVGHGIRDSNVRQIGKKSADPNGAENSKTADSNNNDSSNSDSNNSKSDSSDSSNSKSDSSKSDSSKSDSSESNNSESSNSKSDSRSSGSSGSSSSGPEVGLLRE
jgi:hypothetical protein